MCVDIEDVVNEFVHRKTNINVRFRLLTNEVQIVPERLVLSATNRNRLQSLAVFWLNVLQHANNYPPSRGFLYSKRRGRVVLDIPIDSLKDCPSYPFGDTPAGDGPLQFTVYTTFAEDDDDFGEHKVGILSIRSPTAYQWVMVEMEPLLRRFDPTSPCFRCNCGIRPTKVHYENDQYSYMLGRSFSDYILEEMAFKKLPRPDQVEAHMQWEAEHELSREKCRPFRRIEDRLPNHLAQHSLETDLKETEWKRHCASLAQGAWCTDFETNQIFQESLHAFFHRSGALDTGQHVYIALANPSNIPILRQICAIHLQHRHIDLSPRLSRLFLSVRSVDDRRAFFTAKQRVLDSFDAREQLYLEYKVFSAARCITDHPFDASFVALLGGQHSSTTELILSSSANFGYPKRDFTIQNPIGQPEVDLATFPNSRHFVIWLKMLNDEFLATYVEPLTPANKS